MTHITQDELDSMVQEANDVDYRLEEYSDPWYPTQEEVLAHIRTFKKQDILFLLWLTETGMNLTPIQEEQRRQIHKILYDQSVLKVDEPEQAQHCQV